MFVAERERSQKDVKGVSIADIARTITLDIPNAAEGYDKYPYFVKDVASKGLTVNKDFKAVVRAADGTA